MKRSLKILGGIATAVAIVALVAPASHAQCPQARSFGGFPGGKTGSQVIVDASAFENAGNEFGQFWETGNAANGTGIGAAGTCDSQGVGVGWWQFVGTTTDRGIRGFVAQPGCTLPVCPGVGSGLTFLVEDLTGDGQAGGYVVYDTDETPAGARWYDHARTDPNAAPGSSLTHLMTPLPSVVVNQSTGPPPNTTVDNDYNDVGIAIHSVADAGGVNVPNPASFIIDSYDVLFFQGANPPGALRSNWTFVKSIAYNDAAIVADQVNVPCPDGPTSQTFLAIGMTFNGVPSETVGPPSLPVACDPNVADPQPDDRRPKFTRPSKRGR
jgi:hypothetical protein